MSATPTSEPTSQLNYEPEFYIPPPTDLPYDDGEPLESNRHRIAMNTLIDSLEQTWSDRTNFFCGGNMFIYFSSAQVRNRDYRGPDFFVVLDVDGSRSRQTWTVWEEGGRYPDVIVELLSASTAEADLGIKKNLYEQVFKTPDYFVFNPFDPNSLQGWHLDGLRYQPLVANEQGWLWSQSLELWLGTWEGTINRETAVWLRFYDTQGRLVLLPEEAAQQQATAAQQQLAAEQQRTRELEAILAQYQQRFGDTTE